MRNVTQSIRQGLRSTLCFREMERLQDQVIQLQDTLANLLNLMHCRHETSLTREDLEYILPWDFEYIAVQLEELDE